MRYLWFRLLERLVPAEIHALNKVLQRMREMTNDLSQLSATITEAISVLQSATADKEALAKAQADLEQAQSDVAATQSTIDDLTAQLKAALPAATTTPTT